MKWFYKLLMAGLALGVISAFLLTGAGVFAYYHSISPNLPDVEELRKIQLQVPLRIYSKEGDLIAEFGEKRRSSVQFSDIPRSMVNAIIAAEDDDFFHHSGIDLRGLARAGLKLLMTGERQQGGSTITMQVARNFYLTRQKTYLRKIYEIFLALRIEQKLTKGEIFELYVNKIYLGQRAYGIAAAAKAYYGATLDQLTLAQTAMIAGLPKAPSSYNPLINPERALNRRNYVLGRMLTLQLISQAAYDKAMEKPVSAKKHTPEILAEAPYIAEMARAEMVKTHGDSAYTDGYHVYTTIQTREQTAANRALRQALNDYTDRHGYHGPIKHLDWQKLTDDELNNRLQTQRIADLQPAIVTQVDPQSVNVRTYEQASITLPWPGLQWAKAYQSVNRQGPAPENAADLLKTGDFIHIRNTANGWRLAQKPKVSGALTSLRSSDGAILALVGGYDYYTSQFNRATQAMRQPGSGLKPFVYAAALAKDFTPASIINDAPVVFDDPSLEGAWRPKNYSGRFYGPTRLRVALTYSRNLVSVRLLKHMGIQDTVEYITKFGFSADKLSPNLSLALGNASVTPLQMARGYAVLSNGGYLVEPYFIERVDQGGKTVYRHDPFTACENDCPKPAPRAISAQNRFLMYSILQDVIRYGTATKAKKLGRKDIAGKTGTTNDQRDAWFNGFNGSIVTSVWVGFDDNSVLGRGEVGGRAALPAWIDYMQTALTDIEDQPPRMPEGITTVRIDAKTGLRASTATRQAMFEIFADDKLPDSPSDTPTDSISTPVFNPPGTSTPPPDDELF